MNNILPRSHHPKSRMFSLVVMILCVLLLPVIFKGYQSLYQSLSSKADTGEHDSDEVPDAGEHDSDEPDFENYYRLFGERTAAATPAADVSAAADGSAAYFRTALPFDCCHIATPSAARRAADAMRAADAIRATAARRVAAARRAHEYGEADGAEDGEADGADHIAIAAARTAVIAARRAAARRDAATPVAATPVAATPASDASAATPAADASADARRAAGNH
eukprot:GHVH01001496.1.p1 GENE.GHVH01001496.1~~GHVH01001496.1.p1  ORF type:complete len:223 (-),score=51.00 GHVH01001496.1:80-748(-)